MPNKVLKESEKGRFVSKEHGQDSNVQAHTVYSESEKVAFVEELYEKVLQHGNKWKDYHDGNSSIEPETVQEFCKKIVKESKIL